MNRHFAIRAAACTVVAIIAKPSLAATTYTIQRIGTIAPSNQLGSDPTFGQTVEQSSLYYADPSGIVVGGEATPTTAGSAGTALWYFNGTTSLTIGLTGTQYQRSNRQNILNSFLNTAYGNSRIFNNGYVTGITNRYDGVTPTPNNVGEDAWIFNGNGATSNNTVQIPLPSSVDMPTSSASSSSAPILTPPATLSYSYNTGTTNGIFENFLSVQSGGNGSAAGTIQLYYNTNGASTTGWASKATDAWYYDGSSTKEIGLDDGKYVNTTSNTPFTRSSNIVRINKTGQVLGTSSYYGSGATSAAAGTDVWIYDPSNLVGATVPNGTKLIGPTTFVPGDIYAGIGTSGASPVYLTNSGIVAAQYQLFASSDTDRATTLGTDAYLYKISSATWTQVGLTGSDYTFYAGSGGTAKTGFGGSTIPNLSLGAYDPALNEAGQATGFTKRTGQLSGSPVGLGQDAWVYYPSTVGGVGPGSVRVGLVGGAYENTSVGTGLVTRSSTPSVLSAGGQVSGNSTRYISATGATTAGQDAWDYDPAHGITPAVLIGLNSDTGFAANHEWTNPAVGTTNTSRNTVVTATNSLGMVGGFSSRYTTGTTTGSSKGQDAWVYSPVTNKTYSVDPNSPAANTVWASTISYISDSGVALGFDAATTNTPLSGSSDYLYKLFKWSLDYDSITGLNDIPDFQYLDVVTADVDPSSFTNTTWHELFDTVNFAPSMTASGNIVGLGGLNADYLPNNTTTSNAPFVLVAVPEPASIALFAPATALLLRRRRRVQ